MPTRKLIGTLLIFLFLSGLAGCSETREISETETIPYKTVKKNNGGLLEGRRKLSRPGKTGLRTVVYQETYKWGNKTGRKKVKDTVVVKPDEEIIELGTKKSVKFKVIDNGASFDVFITDAERLPNGFGTGKDRIPGDAVLVKGIIKNTSKQPVSTGQSTDLAAQHPSFRGGLAFLAASAVRLEPDQELEVNWVGSINNNRPGTNVSLRDLSEVNIIPRAFVDANNRIIGEPRPLVEPAGSRI